MKIAIILAYLVLVAAAAVTPPPWVQAGEKERSKENKGSSESRDSKEQTGTVGQPKTGGEVPKLTSALLRQFSSGCGRPSKPPNTLKIVGGTEARYNSWPWMARLTYNGWLKCGGSLVTNQHIVTAAHCVIGTYPSYWRVVLGDHRMSYDDGTEKTFKISTYSYHTLYNKQTSDYDIAVFTLATPVTFDENISPVCLPNGMSFSDGDSAYTTGWGRTAWGGSVSDTLLQVYVPIISTESCRNTNYGRSSITDRMICAGYMAGGKDSCSGDSGGPLVCDRNNIWYLCGIVSFGHGCAVAGYPGVYAKTSVLENWINGIIY